MSLRLSSPGGVGDVDSSEVDAFAAHDEERGEAEQRHAAADHRQLGRLPSAQLQLLNDVAAQHDAHAGTGHNDHTWGTKRYQSIRRPGWRRPLSLMMHFKESPVNFHLQNNGAETKNKSDNLKISRTKYIFVQIIFSCLIADAPC